MLELEGIDVGELATALADQSDYDLRNLINPETGEIVLWTSDGGLDGQTRVDLDELDLIRIDPLPSHVWYQDMEDFAGRVTDERATERLTRALRGKGAFRRFKDELHRGFPELVPSWNAFREARARRHAVDWLVDNELIDADAAERYRAEHPEPDLD